MRRDVYSREKLTFERDEVILGRVRNITIPPFFPIYGILKIPGVL